jgi:hypothetical protein
MPSFRRLFRLLVRPVALAVVAGCSDANELPDPTNSNFVDTVTIGALEGTPISTPSGFSIEAGRVRTDQTVQFEFAYNVRRLEDGSPQRVFVPLAALGIPLSSANPGLQRREESFNDIRQAPSNGYVTDSAVALTQGDRFIVRSRVVCAQLGVPKYGKLEILSFQDSTVTFQVLVNNNCGYKDLLPGLPDN